MRIAARSALRPKCYLAGALVLASSSASVAASWQPASTGLPASNAGYNCSPMNPGGWTGVAFADVDRDGDDDLAVVGRLLLGFRVYLSDGISSWAATPSFDATCHGRSDVALADIDGDGDPDLGGIADINVQPTAFRNDLGSWTEARTGLDGGNSEGFAFGDFDGDGHPDIVSIGHFSGGTRAWFGDGAGNWSERSSGLEPTLGGHHAATGDFDGDGVDEIVGTQFGTFDLLQDGVRIWKYDAATATWSALAGFYFDQPYGVAAADANRDGWNDLIVAAAQDQTGTFGGVHVFLNQGAGRSFVEASTGLPVRDAFLGDVAAADLDNDGDLDVVTGDLGGVMRVFLGDGAGNWTEETASGLGNLGDFIEGVATGDFDRDCQSDVAVAAYKRGIRAFTNDTTVACPILAEAGLARVVCGAYTLDGSASRACACPAGVAYRWWDGATLLRDWSPDPLITVAPTATTLYRLDVACAGRESCLVSDGVTLELSGGTVPALGNVLLQARSRPDDIRFVWTDLAVATGDYQILALPATVGPPTQAAFDGPVPTVAASAPPGVERAIAVDVVPGPPDLVFYRVRATTSCGGLAGPA